MRFEERSVPLGSGADQSAERMGGEETMSPGGAAARNMELMQTLDDAWNAQDVETFAKRHRDDVVVIENPPKQRTGYIERRPCSSARPTSSALTIRYGSDAIQGESLDPGRSDLKVEPP